MRIVLDTNVIISAYLFGGRLLELLRLARQGTVEVLTSGEALAELLGVLHTDKFRRRLGELAMTPEDVLSDFSEVAVPLGSVAMTETCRDADDNLFIGIALAGEAKFVLSGDKDLLDCSAQSPVPILRVSDFLALLQGLPENAGERGEDRGE